MKAVVIAALIFAQLPVGKPDDQALRVLTEELRSKLTSERTAAACGLGALGNPDAATALAAAFAKEDQTEAKTEIACALLLLGKPTAEATRYLSGRIHESSFERFSFVAKAIEYGDIVKNEFPPFVELYIPLLGDNDASVRFETILTLGAMRSKDARVVAPLNEIILKGTGERFSEAMMAALHLAEFGPHDNSSIEPLEILLKSKHSGESLAAAAALLAISPDHEAAIKRLRSSFASTNGGDSTRQHFVLLASPAATKLVLPEISAALADRYIDGFQKHRHARVVGKLRADGKPAEKALLAIAAGSDVKLKAVAAEAAVALDERNAAILIPVFRDVIRNGDNSDAATLAKVLAKLPHPPEQLLEFAAEEFPKRRFTAGLYLSVAVLRRTSGHPGADAYLRNVLKNGVPDEPDSLISTNMVSRKNAATAVRVLGRAGSPYRDELNALLSWHDEFVVQEAALTLRVLDAAERKGK